MTDEITELGREAEHKLHTVSGLPSSATKQYKAILSAATANNMRLCLQRYLREAQD